MDLVHRPTPPSMRVLTRSPVSSPPPPRPPSHDATPTTTGTASSSSQSLQFPSHIRSPEGVVVVGFISSSPEHSSNLINRVIDCNVFGSGNLDQVFSIDKEELGDWFRWRRISYYHDEDKRILFLQYCSIKFPTLEEELEDLNSSFDSVLENRHFEDLQGLLFMFSVCHVILYIKEGARFDTQLLKEFRVLQAAKHAFAPFPRSRNPPTSFSSTNSSNSSQGRSKAILRRNSSTISLISGLGSYTSLFPGQCTPVTLFVFVDDFSDLPNPASTVEDSTDISSVNKSSSLNNLARSVLPIKGSGSVVVLARPVGKSEGDFRKQLQSSLEAQIRFLIKKCRTLSSSESNRSGSASNVSPLFSLDASRAVVLLDRSLNKIGKPLERVTDLLEDILAGKKTLDTLLLENQCQNMNRDDFISVKEFIFRQADLLRGRGGSVGNNNSGTAAGVGMVAIAAAAAAASASLGKACTAPELPSLETWISSSQLILRGVLSAKQVCIDESEIAKEKPRQQKIAPVGVEGVASDPLDLAVSVLRSGRGINTEFSTVWCERSFLAAKNVYLKDLPDFYPTSQHDAHLKKAFDVFHSMCRGPAVPVFMTKLEKECTSIWESGRQLCDAISLTGRPCTHQRHDVQNGDPQYGDSVKPHSSGYFFLHACACGRSRHMQADPFDFDSANLATSSLSDCDKLLPAISLPEVNVSGPIRPSSWRLIRVGSSRYYEPSKGLLRSGFNSTHKFLLKWTIRLEKPKNTNTLPCKTVQGGLVDKSDWDTKSEISEVLEVIKIKENVRKPLGQWTVDDKKISFGKGLPNFTMRKPFSEVVSGSTSTNSGFPPLPHAKQSLSGSEKGLKQNKGKDRMVGQVLLAVDQEPSDTTYTAPVQVGIASNNSTNGDPLLRIGRNVIPVNVNNSEKDRVNPPLKCALVYVGFEHECPHGHHFLLDTNHLNELGHSYSFFEQSHAMSKNNLSDASRLGNNDFSSQVIQSGNGATGAAVSKLRNMDKSKGVVSNGNPYTNRKIKFFGQVKEREQEEQERILFSAEKKSDLVEDLASNFLSLSLDDDESAFSLLNRNIPIYMDCPHCRHAQSKKNIPNTKFAGTISQLQRIFLVTPAFPLVLATCPLIQFQESCLPSTISGREQKLQFSLGCQVILPPESFLTLKLPFVYGVELGNGSLHPLNAFEHQPEYTAWITKGTTLQVLSKGSKDDT